MATHYSKERAKYGSGAGTIIVWPVEYSNLDPTAEENIKILPAGYLKCDGSILKALDYPALAEILGVGSASTFIRFDIDGEPIDEVASDEFILPDFGSKYPKPTTGGSAGQYLNILTKNQLGVEKRRSGMGIEASATAGSTTGNTTVIPVTYTGNFIVPSQEIAIKGKASYSKGTNNSGYTDVEAVDSLALHSHMHFSTTNRLRIKTTNELADPQSQGPGSRNVASTVPIQTWLNNTGYNNNAQGPGTNQPACWAIASGQQAAGYQNNGVETNLGFEVNYYNLCYDAEPPTGLNSFRYYCLLTSSTGFNLGNILFGNQPAFKSWGLGLGTCNQLNAGTFSASQNVPATYITGGAGVPVDYNGASLSDVVPINNNTTSRPTQVYPQVNNVATEISELAQTADPTIHSHKILLEKFDHTYKVKTNAYLLSPDNLKTTLTLKTDQVASLDSVTSPYIILEYLIKY